MPNLFRSSPPVRRYFCGTCGSQMAFQADHYPGETHFYAASLTDPGVYGPSYHVHVDEQVDWIALADGLPCRIGHSD